MAVCGARAQQARLPVIGFLSNGNFDQSRIDAFREGLKQVGYVDGQDVTIEYRWAENHNERLSALAADLVSRRVNLVAAIPTPAALAAKVATASIPIVFSVGVDPVRVGLVASLNRPGGNATGLSYLTETLMPKRIEILHQIAPTASSIAVLLNPRNVLIANTTLQEARAGTRALGLQTIVIEASSEREIESAFAPLREKGAGALLIGPDSFFSSHRDQIVALTARYSIPTMFEYREFVVAGGLMSYGANIIETYRLLGTYAGRILQGNEPGDVPVQQVAKVELVLNLKTAKALGLTVPLPLLGRADEVIE